MTPFPKNPFRPGPGLPPAHMGSRPETDSVLFKLPRRLRDRERDMQMVFLFGPRGNGKTALLNQLHAEAAAAKVTTVALSPETVESSARLVHAIRAETRPFPLLRKWLSRLRAGDRSFKPESAGAREAPPIAHVLKQGKSAILLTLDEAQEAPPKILGYLLGAAQIAGANRPIAVVFAGMPGLDAVMRASRVSFWSRGKMLYIGLLEETSARDALARPFRDAGLEADDAAVAELASAAGNHPYFLQLYGEAAWTVVEESGGRAFCAEHVAPTLGAADRIRQDCYRDRYEEIRRADLLPLARRVAEAFAESAAAPADRRLTEAELNELLAYEGGNDHRTFLIAKGYIWRDTPGELSWAPGLPGFMDYMLEHAPDA